MRWAALTRRTVIHSALCANGKGEGAAKQRHVARIMMVYMYGVLGDNDQAFEKAFSEHESSMPSLKTFIACNTIRSDPRFKEMVQRVGLPE